MEQTIEQAAATLGKTVWQIRRMIKAGKLPARKVRGVWVITDAELPRTAEQLEVRAERVERLREVVDVALDPTPARRRRYSVRDLRATQILQPLLQRCVQDLGEEHAATASLLRVGEHLARGCHRFRRAEKADAYREARDEASRTVSVLLADISLALKGRQRELYLDDADERLLVLRVHLRLAGAAGYLGPEQLVHALALADRVGRQLGGWKAWQAAAEVS